MKRIISILTTFSIILSLCACGRQDELSLPAPETSETENPFVIGGGSETIMLGYKFGFVDFPEKCTYTGESIELNMYYQNGSFDLETGFLIFVDGIPQEYSINEQDEQFYMHKFDLKAGERRVTKISFQPNTGEKGDVLNLQFASMLEPSYIAKQNEKYGNNHQLLELVPSTLTFETDSENHSLCGYDIENTALMGDEILNRYTGFGASDFKYRYAIPYGLMLAGGYIKGESSNDNVQFNPIMPEELAMIISVSVLCLVLLSAMVICTFSSRKGIKSIAVILGMSMLLCGCENHDTAIQYFRLNGSEWTDSRNYVFSYLGNGTMINKSTNETNDFIRNPFYDIETDSDKMPITAPIYAVGNKAYYLFDNGVSVIIRERNLDDMSEKVIYENGGDERNYFLGLGHSYADNHSYTINGFFLNDKHIYFVTDRGITQFNRLTYAHAEIIADSRIENAIFDGVDIYYISSDFSLMKYISESGTTEQVISDKLSDCVIIDETIYYCNIEDGKTLYKCGLDGKDKAKLADYPIKALTTDGEYIYFIVSDGLCGEVYRISVKSTVAELFYEGNAYFIYAFSGYDKVLVKVHDESGVMTMVEILKCMEESSLL